MNIPCQQQRNSLVLLALIIYKSLTLHPTLKLAFFNQIFDPKQRGTFVILVSIFKVEVTTLVDLLVEGQIPVLLVKRSISSLSLMEFSSLSEDKTLNSLSQNPSIRPAHM
jgi:hypothetical protein